jgi:two-component system nitrate/nitrite sensor histidine kinase NarX
MEIVKNFIERLRRFSPFRGFQEERRQLEQRAAAAEARAAEADKRLAAFFEFAHSFLEANDEREVVELVLRISVDSVGAQGASLVPVDERGQPMTAVNYGDLPTPVFSAWVEYLASPAVRQRCGTCQNHGAVTNTCPLLKGPFSETVAMYCLPLRRGDRELGVLNLYLPDGHRLTAENQAFLKAMVDETALVLESMRLQKREMAALSQLQAVRRKTDLQNLSDGFLENVRDTFKADIALLRVEAHNLQQEPIMLTLGEIPVQGRAFIDSILQGVLASMEAVLLGDGHRNGLAGDPETPQGFSSLLAVPLQPPEGAVLGAVLVGNRRPKNFTRRHLMLLRTLAGQLALIIQNENLMTELEYKAMMQERTRLAREIHDGLAQTLGFLKLQSAQMKNSLAQGDISRLQQSLDSSYQTLTEAYNDARQAIDSLRIHPAEEGMVAWLEQTLVEFQENHDFVVELSVEECGADLPPEVQAQLIRIVQEALNNVRKHARASRACVRCYINGRDLFLEVQDDGRGFTPEDVPSSSRYGLQGMRERAELIGGEFQVISCSQEGTTVRVRLPMVVGEQIA